MTPEEHKQRHIELHKKLDELLADFLTHTGKSVGNSTLLELMQWSYHQTQNPTEERRSRLDGHSAASKQKNTL